MQFVYSTRFLRSIEINTARIAEFARWAHDERRCAHVQRLARLQRVRCAQRQLQARRLRRRHCARERRLEQLKLDDAIDELDAQRRRHAAGDDVRAPLAGVCCQVGQRKGAAASWQRSRRRLADCTGKRACTHSIVPQACYAHCRRSFASAARTQRATSQRVSSIAWRSCTPTLSALSRGCRLHS